MRCRVVVMAVVLAVMAAGCGDDGDPDTFSWTIHDSSRWGACVAEALGSRARTEASVRKAAEDCVRSLRTDVATKAGAFGDCAVSTDAHDPAATSLDFALDMDDCLKHVSPQGL